MPKPQEAQPKHGEGWSADSLNDTRHQDFRHYGSKSPNYLTGMAVPISKHWRHNGGLTKA